MHASSLINSLLVTAGLGTSLPAPEPPNLVYLFSVFATETPPVIVGQAGHGARVFIPITGGTFSGPNFQGKVLNMGGDWGSYDVNMKVFSPDAKIVLETESGANILVSARGRSPYVSYEFETGSEEFAWLNAVVGVGTVDVGNDTIAADIFQIV